MAFLIGEKQKRAATLLWKGLKTPEIAAVLGIHRSTVWRWFQHEEMREYTQKVFRRNRGRALRKPMKNALSEAVESGDHWRINAAANRILDHCHWVFFDG
ncbi:MAG: helix-turn-helix domain-containing protein [Acidaminococcaceae bacterium]|nr:helix-turn-helix domain-containing protein [Acidaminococcaceae bacterium]